MADQRSRRHSVRLAIPVLAMVLVVAGLVLGGRWLLRRRSKMGEDEAALASINPQA
ncbi:MAG: hypothetical protein ACPGCX_09975 [Ilumatobacteraceae bacterium]